MLKLSGTILCLLTAINLSAIAYAADPAFKATLKGPAKLAVGSLKMPFGSVFDVQVVDAKAKSLAGKVKVEGTFKRDKWKLIIENKQVKPDNKGKFTVELKVKGPSEKIDIIAVGRKGNTEKAQAELVFADWEKFKETYQPKPAPSPSAKPAAAPVSEEIPVSDVEPEAPVEKKK